MVDFVRNTSDCSELESDIFYQKSDLKRFNDDFERAENIFKNSRRELNSAAEDLKKSAVQGLVEVTLEMSGIGKIAKIFKKLVRKPDKSAAIIQALDNFQRALDRYNRAFRQASDDHADMVRAEKKLQGQKRLMEKTARLYERCQRHQGQGNV